MVGGWSRATSSLFPSFITVINIIVKILPQMTQSGRGGGVNGDREKVTSCRLYAAKILCSAKSLSCKADVPQQ